MVGVESWRRMCALVYGLPPDSATWRGDGFTRLEELLAASIEHADFWGRQHAAAPHGLKRHQLPDAVRIPRPGR